MNPNDQKQPKKSIFETVQLLLIAALLFGAPVAASTTKPGGGWAIGQSLKQVGALVGSVAIASILNFTLARLYFSKKEQAQDRHDRPSSK